LTNNRVPHICHKPLAIAGILLLGAGMVGATTRPTHHKNSSKRKSPAFASQRQDAHLDLVSAKSRQKKIKKVRGQQAIQGDRARQIQTALVREGYMKGEPSGVWDQSTKDAMTRYQADHGWQTKTLPDSRALIQLGLGPSHEDAINAQAVPTSLPAKAEPIKASALPQVTQ
jgi:peptidoglycan hydrolase-like protein with peptidoglycan-binding domain